LALTSALVCLVTSQARAQGQVIAIEIDFATHSGRGLFEPDVFVEKVEGSGELYKVGASEVHQYQEAMLHGATEEVEYAPERAGGPYVKGEALGVTLGEWLTASATATYTCEEGKATVNVSFENLVPNGIYTMWNFIEPDPITDPYTGLLWPLGARDGSQSVFKVDAQGDGEYEVVIESCLEMSGPQTISGLAIALHSDGKTYGFQAGAFGVVTHTQMFAFFPKEADVLAGRGQ
jgi:hypothetical protein